MLSGFCKLYWSPVPVSGGIEHRYWKVEGMSTALFFHQVVNLPLSRRRVLPVSLPLQVDFQCNQLSSAMQKGKKKNNWDNVLHVANHARTLLMYVTIHKHNKPCHVQVGTRISKKDGPLIEDKSADLEQISYFLQPFN